MLQALALHEQGKMHEALKTLERALTLAEREGYIRIFVDEGELMKELIKHWRLETRRHKGLTEVQTRLMVYADKLLEAFPSRATQLANSNYPASLVDPLSARELEVLRLIAEGLSNREIANRLFITINTVKKHTRLTFDKLDVANRTHAVARARELGLL
jgi:LuxR family maltose regulon positive regulatory protein